MEAPTVEEFVRVFAAIRPNREWARALERLLPALGRAEVHELLAAVPLAKRRTRAELMRILAPFLDPARLRETVTEAMREAVERPPEAALLVRWAAPYLTPEELAAAPWRPPVEPTPADLDPLERRAAVAGALRECLAGPDAFRRGLTTARLAAWLDPAQRDAVLDLVAGGGLRDVTLIGRCAPFLGPGQLDRALDLLGDPRYDYWGGEELQALVPHLTPVQRARAARDLVARLDRCYGRPGRAYAVALAALAADLRAEQVEVVARIADPVQGVPVLCELLPRLRAEERDRVVAAAAAVEDPQERAATVAALVVHLPKEAWEEAVAATVAAAETIAPADRRAIAFARLGAALPSPERDGLLRRALTLAAAIDGRGRRIRTLAAVGEAITGARPDGWRGWVESPWRST